METIKKEVNGTQVAEHLGHRINFLNISYNCPSLSLFGYSSETSIKRAITAKLKKLTKGKL